MSGSSFTTASPGGLNFSGKAPTTATTGVSFGHSTTAQGGFTLASGGGNSLSKSTTAGGISFGSAPTESKPASMFSFGTASNTTTSAAKPPAASLFGANILPTASTGTGFSQSQASATVSSASPAFNFGGMKAVTSSASFPASGSVSSLLLPTTASTSQSSSQPAFAFGNSNTMTSITTANAVSSGSATTDGFTLTPATSNQSGFKLSTASSLLTATSSVTSASSGFSINAKTPANVATTMAAPVKQMSYKELEDTVEKWLHDLGEQEKLFLNQASQVNVWDRQLIQNGEKVTELHNEVERVKTEQQRLDRELDFILSQQEELEELLQPIETQVKSMQEIQHSQHADIERERTYTLAENIDSQLKHMMQDLKEVIEHINNSNANPVKSVNETMTQVAKILNAHMDSLQWVDQNTNQLQRRVNEVNQLMERRKREHDKTFQLSYD